MKILMLVKQDNVINFLINKLFNKLFKGLYIMYLNI